MFGISILELLVIIIIALVVLKPNHFIALAIGFINIAKKIKSTFQDINNEVEKIGVLNKFDDYIIIEKNNQEDTKKNIKKN